MGKEINLLANYPKTKRNLDERLATKNEVDRSIARQFGREFFDGDRNQGYGGFKYMPKFWQPVVPTFKDYWKLTSSSSLLDVGCAKGFMLNDLAELIPGMRPTLFSCKTSRPGVGFRHAESTAQRMTTGIKERRRGGVMTPQGYWLETPKEGQD